MILSAAAVFLDHPVQWLVACKPVVSVLFRTFQIVKFPFFSFKMGCFPYIDNVGCFFPFYKQVQSSQVKARVQTKRRFFLNNQSIRANLGNKKHPQAACSIYISPYKYQEIQTLDLKSKCLQSIKKTNKRKTCIYKILIYKRAPYIQLRIPHLSECI